MKRARPTHTQFAMLPAAAVVSRTKPESRTHAPRATRDTGGDALDDSFLTEHIEASSDSESEDIVAVQAAQGAEADDADDARAAARLRKKRRKAARAAARADPAGAMPLALQSPERQAAALWSALTSSTWGAALSPLELGSPLPPSALVGLPPGTVTTASSAALDSCRDDLADVVRAALPSWKRHFGLKGSAGMSRPRGAPALVVVTYSAARAAALLKALAPFRIRVAKLFGKHLEPSEQRRDLASGLPVLAAVGTPARMSLLLSDMGDGGQPALRLDSAALVVLDVHPDAKQYTLLDNPTTRGDTATLIGTHVLPLLRKGALKVVLY